MVSYTGASSTGVELGLLEGEVTRRLSPGLAIRLRGENLTGAAPEWVWGYASPGRALYMAILLGGGA